MALLFRLLVTKAKRITATVTTQNQMILFKVGCEWQGEGEKKGEKGGKYRHVLHEINDIPYLRLTL